MKVLQVNSVYRTGSTGKIVFDLHQGLKDRGIQSIVCYGRGLKVREEGVFKTSSELLSKMNALRSRITGLQYNGSMLATMRLIRIIEDQGPDVVHLQCINGHFVNIYKLLAYLRNRNIATILTLHAEFMYTGSCGHALGCNKWKNLTGCGGCPQLWEATKSYHLDRTRTAWIKMNESLTGFGERLSIASVSPWLRDRAEQSQILSGKKHFVVQNGIDTSAVFRPRAYDQLKSHLGIKDEKVVLHVTAGFSLEKDSFKGGEFVVALAERLLGEAYRVVVIGARDSSLKLPTNVLNVGRVTNQEDMASYYSMADLSVITSKRETFSMVCAESLACGTPVVGFNGGGPEQISLKEFSEFVDYGDTNALEAAVRKWISVKSQFAESIRTQAAPEYSVDTMVDGYCKLYERVLSAAGNQQSV